MMEGQLISDIPKPISLELHFPSIHMDIGHFVYPLNNYFCHGVHCDAIYQI